MRYKVQRKFKPRNPVLGQFTCRECGEDFEGYYTYNRLVICSDVCRTIRHNKQQKAIQARYRAKNYHPPLPRNCVMCDKAYTPGGTRSDSRFCSLKCCLRGNQIERTYKLDLASYHDMVIAQKGICAACLTPIVNETPHIDHDHDTGAVRGLVHSVCNSVLGFMNDDVTKLENLVKYLRRS